ncbi:hypothetical protein G7Y89_g13330 [Cudoniella acicularis]|uniref:Uncharacterized protein n=1 Tax=Cudoniella acicularis TaxID=354080 RepID=A0A8H4VWJ2_9HELO|nr:hypothetical protein G7Y89_g13330 [Cudoniella acicularis]
MLLMTHGEERFDEDDDETSEEQEENKGGEEIHGSDFSQYSTKEGNNSDVGRDENPANRELARNEEQTNNPGPGEVGSRQEERKHVDSRGADFRQVLSQVNFYITQNACQYGFVVTERELVALYRPGRKGLLKVSGSFPIRTRTEGLGQGEREGMYPSSSSPGDLCADEALLALILWAADPPSPETDPADKTCDAEAEEDKYYPIIEALAFSSDGPTSAEKESVFSPSNSGRQSSSPLLPDRKRVRSVGRRVSSRRDEISRLYELVLEAIIKDENNIFAVIGKEAGKTALFQSPPRVCVPGHGCHHAVSIVARLCDRAVSIGWDIVYQVGVSTSRRCARVVIVTPEAAVSKAFKCLSLSTFSALDNNDITGYIDCHEIMAASFWPNLRSLRLTAPIIVMGSTRSREMELYDRAFKSAIPCV